MKKWITVLVISALFLAACQKDTEEKQEKEKQKETKVTEQVPAEEGEEKPKEEVKAAKLEKEINEKVKVSALGWDQVNKDNAYIEFSVKKDGKWTKGLVQPMKDSVQFEAKLIQVTNLNEKTQMVTVLYKDTARGNLGVVSHYLVNDKGEVEHAGDFARGTYLQEEIKELNASQMKELKSVGYIDENSSEKGVMVFWSNYAVFLGYNEEKNVSIIKEIHDTQTVANILFGEGNYVGITLEKEGLSIASMTGDYLERKTDEKTKLENITVKKGTNLVFLNRLEGVTVHSDINNPNAFFENSTNLTNETIVKMPFIQDIKPGVYLFALENFEKQEYNGFQLIVK